MIPQEKLRKAMKILGLFILSSTIGYLLLRGIEGILLAAFGFLIAWMAKL